MIRDACMFAYNVHPCLSLNIADVNECDLASDCEENCTNTVGSYYCECLDGRVLVNRTHCTGKIIGILNIMHQT